jgi:hypothetical protein
MGLFSPRRSGILTRGISYITPLSWVRLEPLHRVASTIYSHWDTARTNQDEPFNAINFREKMRALCHTLNIIISTPTRNINFNQLI